MRNKTKAPPMYEQIYRCLLRRGLVVGKEIKANDAHCARIAAEDLNTPVKSSYIAYVRKKYGLTNPNQPPTYKEIDEAICEIITDADITIKRYDIYQEARFENGRVKKGDIYFGIDEAKKNIPPTAMKVIYPQSFVALKINDKQMAEMVSEKLGRTVKINQITYWRKQNGVAASHINHGGKREYIPNQEDTTALLQKNHRWDTYRLSRDQSRISYAPIGEETVSYAQAVQSMLRI